MTPPGCAGLALFLLLVAALRLVRLASTAGCLRPLRRRGRRWCRGALRGWLMPGSPSRRLRRRAGGLRLGRRMTLALMPRGRVRPGWVRSVLWSAARLSRRAGRRRVTDRWRRGIVLGSVRRLRGAGALRRSGRALVLARLLLLARP